MAIEIIKAGLQSSLQGRPYDGHRHDGMPAAGAADSLNLALANRLVGNAPDALAIEITLNECQLVVRAQIAIAVTGGAGYLRVNSIEKSLHQTILLQPNDVVEIGRAIAGCRSYLAFSATIEADSLWSNQSTYIPAGLAGFRGRALKNGDILRFSNSTNLNGKMITTPDLFRTTQGHSFILRTVAGIEFSSLSPRSAKLFPGQHWIVTNRSNRTGIMLEGKGLETETTQPMQSSPVFPGTIQCPPDGKPFILGPDAQTTGGYPRIAQVIRADRHLIGQLSPGSNVQFVLVTPNRATEIYREKLKLLKPWLGNITLW